MTLLTNEKYQHDAQVSLKQIHSNLEVNPILKVASAISTYSTCYMILLADPFNWLDMQISMK